jgi:transcriptional regulator with XRE-family HTH domain
MDNGETFGKKLTAAWEAAGGPSYRQLEREAVEVLGRYAPSNTTISNYHKGKIAPGNADVALVAWLAERYGVSVTSLSEILGERLQGTRDLLMRSSGWFHRPDLVAA